MPLKEKPYWMDTVSIPTADASVPLPEVVDVAVIGGGFTGLSAALALAPRGAKVAVLEAETFGWGASSRNGGMVLTGLKKGHVPVERLQHGHQRRRHDQVDNPARAHRPFESQGRREWIIVVERLPGRHVRNRRNDEAIECRGYDDRERDGHRIVAFPARPGKSI
ncbi:MAG TPA: FAD-dependent oxidoreductase [Bryobacteraceae bacterium]|nr:FAD-dependent oxidoreductase [Bryobacteraceae bacterium]